MRGQILTIVLLKWAVFYWGKMSRKGEIKKAARKAAFSNSFYFAIT